MRRHRTDLGTAVSGWADRPPVWTRARMLALLAGGAAVVLLLAAGLVLAVVDALRPGHGGAAATAGRGSGRAPVPSGVTLNGPGAADRLAARAMPSVPDSAAHPSAVSLADPGPPILMPAASGNGPAGVPTGFPHSAAGALAQFAALDTAALDSASLPGARAVIASWALPGGPTTSSWSGVRGVAELLDGAGLSGGGSPELAVVATPLMGLVKGTVGSDLVVPCVDFEVDVTLNTTARGAVADCQRMAWTGHRWMVGPGAEPADAPSVWPDTDLAMSVGYRDLRRG